MKIESVSQHTVHFVTTNNPDTPKYTRYAPDSWTVQMGESDEQVYDCRELESAFQAFIAPKTIPRFQLRI